MASRITIRSVLFARSFSSNHGHSAVGRRFVSSKSSGFASRSSRTVPLVFGATLGVGSVLGGLYAATNFNTDKSNLPFFSMLPLVHAAKKVKGIKANVGSSLTPNFNKFLIFISVF